MEPQWKLYEPNGNDEIIESSCFLKLWQLNGHYFQVFEKRFCFEFFLTSKP